MTDKKQTDPTPPPEDKPEAAATEPLTLQEPGTEVTMAPAIDIGSLMLSDPKAFEHAQRVAVMFSRSSLVPKAYQGNVANCMIACEIAARKHMSPMQVMQSLDVINGQPGWDSQFMIATINTCGKFKAPGARFEMRGEVGSMSRSCKCTAVSKYSGTVVEGTEVSMEMAKKEGWLDRPGSKWKSMPEQMLVYRAASFFARKFCPEELLGMRDASELGDIIDVTPERGNGGATGKGMAGAAEILAGQSE